MSWENTFKKGKEIVFCTVSEDGSPHANIVLSEGFVDDLLLINDCEMNRSIRNLKRDNRVCLVASDSKEYYRIEGEVTICNSGKYFDIAVKQNEGDVAIKNTILVDVKSVFDLDKGKVIV